MSDRILGAVCVVVGAGMAWAARGYVAPISYEPVGPSSFPMLMAGLMAATGAWLVVKPGQRGFAMARTQLKPFAMSVLAVFIYAGLFELLGFTVATTVMAVPVGMAFGGGWKKSLLGGIGIGLALYLLFDKLLDVVLPTGILSFIFGGR
ncbi:MAG: tripartite tricarboxylate transporter TctB family protein [Rhodoferax sp.]|nr:tripartite tricarboxylate transporter TctB family protein [Rhodoferax sp.]